MEKYMSKITKKCLYCGDEFESYQSQKRKYCCIICKNKHQSVINMGNGNPNKRNGDYIEVEKTCIYCGVVFKGLPKRLYCSVSCKSKDQDHQNFWSYDKTGKNNPNWKGDEMIKICPWCEKEYRSRVLTQTYCSKKCFSEKMRHKLKNGHAAHMNSFISNPSKPQVELYEMVVKLEPTAILNHPSLNYSIDIAVPDKMIAIEYDGSYWHKNKENDDRRQKELEQQGWKFIRYIDIVPQLDILISDIERL
jgi:hypothetical protein